MSSSSLKVFVCQREIYRTYVLTYFNSVVATIRNLKIIFRSLIWRLLRELHTRIILINAPLYWKLKFLFAVTDQKWFSTKMLEGVCFSLLQTCNIPDCEGVRRFKVWFIRTIAGFSYNDHSSNYSWIIWVLYTGVPNYFYIGVILSYNYTLSSGVLSYESLRLCKRLPQGS